jgi:hypothetical protein
MLEKKVHWKERKCLFSSHYFIEAKYIELSTIEVHVITCSFKKCFDPFIFLIKSFDLFLVLILRVFITWLLFYLWLAIKQLALAIYYYLSRIALRVSFRTFCCIYKSLVLNVHRRIFVQKCDQLAFSCPDTRFSKHIVESIKMWNLIGRKYLSFCYFINGKINLSFIFLQLRVTTWLTFWFVRGTVHQNLLNSLV